MSIPSKLSYLAGPSTSPLWNVTLGDLLREQAEATPSKPCVIFSEVGQRSTYKQLHERCIAVSKGLIASGITRGDNIGVFAGNCSAFVELMFASSYVGAALVLLNCSYTAVELKSAVKHSGKRISEFEK